MGQHAETYLYPCPTCGEQRSEPRRKWLDRCTCREHEERARSTRPEGLSGGHRIEPVFDPGEWED